MPVIREPTDYIPNSADSSQNTSREVTKLSGFNKSEHSVDTVQSKESQRPKVVSIFCRQHEGQSAPAPYSIKPSQMVF